MASKSTGKQVSISINLKCSVFYMGSIIAFTFNNSINKKPSGEFIINDSNSDALQEMSGNFGSIMFYNNNDGVEDKNSVINFVVDAMLRIDSTNGNSTYKIMWSAGSSTSLKKDTWAVSGTSIDAMLEIGKRYNVKTTELMSSLNYTRPVDSMVWRYVSDNAWDAFERTIVRSYAGNDYLFWVYDDINNTMKLSSFQFELAKQDSSLMLYSDNARTTSDDAKTILDKPKLTLWAYGATTRFNNLGESKGKLFPNVAFSGVNNGEMKKAGYVGPCFDSVLQSNGNNSKDAILKQSGFQDKNAMYGDLRVVRNYPNNTHKMYSLAPTVRDYYISTYAKSINMYLYNTLGPEIGTKVSVLMHSNDKKLHGNSIDTQYTDEYIITDKIVKFSNLSPTNTGKMVTKNTTEVSVLLKMSSNHLKDEGFDSVKKLFDLIQGK